MDTKALTSELNGLIQTESASLVRHLHEAQPYFSQRTFHAWRELQKLDLNHVSQDHVGALVGMLKAIDAPVAPVAFPADVARFHFMRIDAMLGFLIEEKRRQITAYDRAIEHAHGNASLRDGLQTLRASNHNLLGSLQSMLASIEPGIAVG